MVGYRRPASYAFGEALYEQRKHAGWTQVELASRIEGVDAETISRYERGVREPKVGRLIAISAALDIAPARLLPTPESGETSATWQQAVYSSLTQSGSFTPNEAEAMLEILEAAARNIPRLRSL